MTRSRNGHVRYIADALILLAPVGQIRNRVAHRMDHAMRLTVRSFAASDYVVMQSFWSSVITVDRPGSRRKFFNAALPWGSRKPTSLVQGLVRLSALFGLLRVHAYPGRV